MGGDPGGAGRRAASCGQRQVGQRLSGRVLYPFFRREADGKIEEGRARGRTKEFFDLVGAQLATAGAAPGTALRFSPMCARRSVLPVPGRTGHAGISRDRKQFGFVLGMALTNQCAIGAGLPLLLCRALLLKGP